MQIHVVLDKYAYMDWKKGNTAKGQYNHGETVVIYVAHLRTLYSGLVFRFNQSHDRHRKKIAIRTDTFPYAYPNYGSSSLIAIVTLTVNNKYR